MKDKFGDCYPINPYLKSLLDDTLSDGRWDMPYLGMQVLIEGLALAAFGVLGHDTATSDQTDLGVCDGRRGPPCCLRTNGAAGLLRGALTSPSLPIVRVRHRGLLSNA